MTLRLTIGLNGLPQVGKDSIADHLAEQHGFKKFAFATALKDELVASFGLPSTTLFNDGDKQMKRSCLALKYCWNDDFIAHFLRSDEGLEEMRDSATRDRILKLPRSPRWLMQRWGTEYRRGQHPLYWIQKVQDQIDMHPCDNIVISDVRFEDEVRMVLHHQPAEIWRITRPSVEAGDTHASNIELPDELVAREIFNTHTRESLLSMVDRVLGDAFEAAQTRIAKSS